MKAREVREQLRTADVNPIVRAVFEALAEDNTRLKQAIVGMQTDMNRMADILNNILTVVGNVSERLKKHDAHERLYGVKYDSDTGSEPD